MTRRVSLKELAMLCLKAPPAPQDVEVEGGEDGAFVSVYAGGDELRAHLGRVSFVGAVGVREQLLDPLGCLALLADCA